MDDEDECMTPGKVDLPMKVLSVSAGDSHTAVLASDGHVFIWGTFRVSQQHCSVLFLCEFLCCRLDYFCCATCALFSLRALLCWLLIDNLISCALALCDYYGTEILYGHMNTAF